MPTKSTQYCTQNTNPPFAAGDPVKAMLPDGSQEHELERQGREVVMEEENTREKEVGKIVG